MIKAVKELRIATATRSGSVSFSKRNRLTVHPEDYRPYRLQKTATRRLDKNETKHLDSVR